MSAAVLDQPEEEPEHPEPVRFAANVPAPRTVKPRSPEHERPDFNLYRGRGRVVPTTAE